MNDRASPHRSRLRVVLAGYNGDVEVLRRGSGHFSPETLSAAYARISRSADPVGVLRERARDEVERARTSNRTIVFGLGHHSVAEHAVLNFDIVGCSRLAIEALEWHRLCSFTEKSQRYITLEGDFVIPAELVADEVALLTDLVDEQNRTYVELLPALYRRQQELHPEMLERRADRRVVEGWAKEDARYVVALATEGQLGFTANARNLELVVRRMRQADLEEVRRLARLLFDQAREVVPSLIILADEEAFRSTYGATLRDAFFSHGAADLAEAVAGVEVAEIEVPLARRGDVSLLGHTPRPDVVVVSALLFAAGKGSLAACAHAAGQMGHEAHVAVVRGALAHLSEYDSLPRAFEQAMFHLEVVVDASAMAQLKRHRMATQLWGPYDPELGVTVPPEVEEIGARPRFAELMERTAATHARLCRSLGARGETEEAATYALTNAHRRRVALTMNLREVYHFSRLREDCHAQWAIRRLAGDISALVREVAPATSLLLAGKDRFAETFHQVMGRDPEQG